MMLFVNGDVEGDVFAAGQTVMVNGRINGDPPGCCQDSSAERASQRKCPLCCIGCRINGNVGDELDGCRRSNQTVGRFRVGQDALVFGRYMSAFR